MEQVYINKVGFRQDNTYGYTNDELSTLNVELEKYLSNLEPYSDEWYHAAKTFMDKVARR